MQIDQYESYIGRIEKRADKSHRLFRLRVSAFLALGYLLMVIILVTILALGILLLFGRVFLMSIRLLSFGFHFSAGLLRGIWVRIDPSDDLELDPSRIKPLYDMVQEICVQLKAPKIDKIFLSFDCNASARQKPFFGPFGPFKNELTLGLPLLAAFTKDEVRSIFAHEIGHIRGRHSRFGLRVGQVSEAWSEAINALTEQKLNYRAVLAIFNWYAPRLSAARIVLSRIAEREANQAELEVGGKEAIAQSFVDLAIFGPAAEQTFDKVMVESFAATEMPRDFLVRYCEVLRQPLAREEMISRVKRALAVPFDPFSTHPPMSQILRESGIEPTLYSLQRVTTFPEPNRVSAGEAIFGSEFSRFLEFTSLVWVAKNEKFWEMSKKGYEEANRELEKILAEVAIVPPSNSQRIELGHRLFELDRFDEALSFIKPIHDLNAETRLAYGILLREKGDASWLEWAEKAAQDTSHRRDACELLIPYYTQRGERGEVQRLIRLLDQLHADDAKAAANLEKLSGFWTYIPATRTADEIRVMVAALSSIKSVKKAYLVCRTTADSRHKNDCIIVEYGSGFVSPEGILKSLSKHEVINTCSLFVQKRAPDFVSNVPGSLIFERRK